MSLKGPKKRQEEFEIQETQTLAADPILDSVHSSDNEEGEYEEEAHASASHSPAESGDEVEESGDLEEAPIVAPTVEVKVEAADTQAPVAVETPELVAAAPVVTDAPVTATQPAEQVVTVTEKADVVAEKVEAAAEKSSEADESAEVVSKQTPILAKKVTEASKQEANAVDEAEDASEVAMKVTSRIASMIKAFNTPAATVVKPEEVVSKGTVKALVKQFEMRKDKALGDHVEEASQEATKDLGTAPVAAPEKTRLSK